MVKYKDKTEMGCGWFPRSAGAGGMRRGTLGLIGQTLVWQEGLQSRFGRLILSKRLPILFTVIRVTGETKTVWKEVSLVIFLDK